MELIVSLPENSLEMAQAAAAAGADAIKVHMNVEHRASGTYFGPFAKEAETVRSIISGVDCPVGLMPGAEYHSLPTFDELSALAKDGLAFVDIYAKHMPLWFLDLPLELILALDSFAGFVEEPYYTTHFPWPPEAHKNRIKMCEASIFKPEEYGTPFSYRDFRRLRILQEYVDVPLLIPTQKAITPNDAIWLKRTGTGGLMIGAVVTGKTPESIAKATAEYRRAIDSE